MRRQARRLPAISCAVTSSRSVAFSRSSRLCCARSAWPGTARVECSREECLCVWLITERRAAGHCRGVRLSEGREANHRAIPRCRCRPRAAARDCADTRLAAKSVDSLPVRSSKRMSCPRPCDDADETRDHTIRSAGHLPCSRCRARRGAGSAVSGIAALEDVGFPALVGGALPEISAVEVAVRRRKFTRRHPLSQAAICYALFVKYFPRPYACIGRGGFESWTFTLPYPAIAGIVRSKNLALGELI